MNVDYIVGTVFGIWVLSVIISWVCANIRDLDENNWAFVTLTPVIQQLYIITTIIWLFKSGTFKNMLKSIWNIIKW